MGETAKPADGEITFGGSLMHDREPDFSGWATKANLKCSDGRTILKDAFKHQDSMTVPLVWQHNHNTPDNVLGHTVLMNRDEGVYVHAFFNDSPTGVQAKTLVEHKDINFLSIYANQLVQKGKDVLHGMIREVSLVMAGANPGAMIDNVAVAHSDGEIVIIDDEAVIYSGLELEHEDKPEETEKTEETVEHAEDGVSIQAVYDNFDPEQKKVVDYMIGQALQESSAAEHSDNTPEDKPNSESEGTPRMTRNLFEESNKDKKGPATHELTHDAMAGIFADAQSMGSFKKAIEGYTLKHGIDNIEILFPDARAAEATPDFDKRRMEWVSAVINGTKKSPFTRIKNFWADITHEQARAKGYIKGTMKKEEWFGVSTRSTGPATVYKKQKLDRDDILDITDFDVVQWMKGEMRLMIEEEIARAILIGDGREVDDTDKIKDPVGANTGDGIRSILNDHDLYAGSLFVNIDDASSDYSEVVDAVIRGMRLYKGSGSPTLFTTFQHLTEMLLLKDDNLRRMYRTTSELANELQVANIVTVEVMEDETDLIGIIVNLKDYTVGTDKGGDLTSFEDFDIDYNQYKYLIETRLSGALTKIRSALIVKKVASGAALKVPTEPAFVPDTGVITVPTITGVTYKRSDTNATVTTGAPITLATGASLKIYAVPTSSSYFFADNVDDEWTFTQEDD